MTFFNRHMCLTVRPAASTRPISGFRMYSSLITLCDRVVTRVVTGTEGDTNSEPLAAPDTAWSVSIVERLETRTLCGCEPGQPLAELVYDVSGSSVLWSSCGNSHTRVLMNPFPAITRFLKTAVIFIDGLTTFLRNKHNKHCHYQRAASAKRRRRRR